MKCFKGWNRGNLYLCANIMKVFYDLSELNITSNPLVTIGTFDGVHLGHKQVIEKMVQMARKKGVECMLITFDPHPREALGLGEISLLSILEEKILLLQETELDFLLVVPFTKEFSQLTALDFIHQYLVQRLAISGVILGYDHKFGNNREGNIGLLRRELSPQGIEVVEISAQAVDSIIVSSTKIRNALSSGNPKEANRLLGYHYSFVGTVVHGAKNGRTLSYPTANLELRSCSKLIPGQGVYAVKCEIAASSYWGMMNIGIRPTLHGIKEVIEVHILDFNSDIYGSEVRVFMHDRIRNERKFNTLNELKEQLSQDEAHLRHYFLRP